MPTICMHCISNTNSTNIINLNLDIIHTPHKHSFWQVVLIRSSIRLFFFIFYFSHCMLILVHVLLWQCEQDMVNKRRSESHEIIVQSVGLIYAEVTFLSQSSIVFPLIGISLSSIVIWKTRQHPIARWHWKMWLQISMCKCFARVDVNVTIYRSFARASIHVNVTICKGNYSHE